MFLPIKDKFISAISNQLGFIHDIKDRLRVESDLDVFNKKEDQSIWLESKGEVPNYFTVYFDDVYVMGFDDSEFPAQTFLRFSKELRTLAKAGRVNLDRNKAIEEEMIRVEAEKAIKKEREAKIEALPDSTKEQKMAKEVIKRAYRRVSTKRQNKR